MLCSPRSRYIHTSHPWLLTSTGFGTRALGRYIPTPSSIVGMSSAHDMGGGKKGSNMIRVNFSSSRAQQSGVR